MWRDVGGLATPHIVRRKGVAYYHHMVLHACTTTIGCLENPSDPALNRAVRPSNATLLGPDADTPAVTTADGGLHLTSHFTGARCQVRYASPRSRVARGVRAVDPLHVVARRHILLRR